MILNNNFTNYNYQSNNFIYTILKEIKNNVYIKHIIAKISTVIIILINYFGAYQMWK